MRTVTEKSQARRCTISLQSICNLKSIYLLPDEVQNNKSYLNSIIINKNRLLILFLLLLQGMVYFFEQRERRYYIINQKVNKNG
jgi:hypothetical protein